MYTNSFFVASATLTVTTFIISIIYFIYGKEEIHKKWLYKTIALFVWGLGATLTSKTTDVVLSNIYYRIACVGATYIPVLVLHYTFVLTKFPIKKSLMFSYLLSSLFSILLLTTDLIYQPTMNKFYKLFWLPVPGNYFFSWFIFWVFIVILAYYHLIRFCIFKRGFKQIEAKYFFLASFFGFLSGMLNFMLPFNFEVTTYANFGIAAYCLLFTYSIARYKLFGIEIMFKKGVFYSLLIGTLTSIYLILVLIVELLFRGVVGYKSLLISLLSAFIIAVLFNPIYKRIQSIIDNFFLGKNAQEIALENELLRQELERSERLKSAGTLALGLAHEIKNPLTTIKTFAEYLPEKYTDPDFVKKFASLIPSEVERINKIVMELLQFSKPLPPLFENVDIRQLIREMLDLETSDFLRHKVIAEEHCYTLNPIVNADAAQLKQAFLNIIINAMDAMPNGGKLEIRIMQMQDGYLAVEIIDQGKGISREDLKHIFDPFFTTKDEGTGLGLGISHQIIKNHNGFIEVESQVDIGTIFRIKLPQKIG